MRDARAALVAGFAASFAMDVVQAGFAALSGERDPEDLDEETEAIASVVARMAPFVPGKLVERHPATTGRLVHYAFGALFALAYAAGRRQAPVLGLWRGAGFGAALWFLSDVVLVPAAHFGRPWFRYRALDRVNAFASHLAYGLTVDAVIARGS